MNKIGNITLLAKE